ncbi:Mrp/NBP35 family ATP-binding protein [Paenibacillus sp.]|uniref:Mrp/NBP35 family ATP-binding protein n=1 Tax=Paenibacillus sp. TaxID=58172 RepID=UPI002D41AEE6|nr:Mrp/NBP35 family ATP-binding protein [Paenibacillus sp.]HZG55575.1 Mrp/NBP35 family ATP-binding protein [Paenibacillus sp.]
MITRNEAIQALEHIRDPDSGLSLVELGLIRDVMAREAGVSLTLVLATDDAEAKGEMESAVREALGEVGVSAEQIHIRSREVTDYERGEIAKKLQAAAQQAETAEAARPRSPALLDASHPATFIAVASGKGGVGKSTVTVNLAVALARRGKRVGLIDADIYGFSVPDMMGIESRPAVGENGGVEPVTSHGVKVISMGFFVEDNAPVIWRGPMLGKMLRNFFNEIQWGELDYVLLDLPPGTGDVALDVHQMLPHSKEIIVTTPHATAAFVAARAGAMARHTNHEILGIVENMAWYERGGGERDYVFGRGGGAKLAEELHTELLLQVPLGAPDNHPSERDYSPSIYKEDSPTGKLYLELADRVIAKTGK